MGTIRHCSSEEVDLNFKQYWLKLQQTKLNL